MENSFDAMFPDIAFSSSILPSEKTFIHFDLISSDILDRIHNDCKNSFLPNLTDTCSKGKQQPFQVAPFVLFLSLVQHQYLKKNSIPYDPHDLKSTVMRDLIELGIRFYPFFKSSHPAVQLAKMTECVTSVQVLARTPDFSFGKTCIISNEQIGETTVFSVKFVVRRDQERRLGEVILHSDALWFLPPNPPCPRQWKLHHH